MTDEEPETPTPEELEAQFNRESVPDRSMNVMAIDIDIHFKDGPTFHVNAEEWGYHAYGLFACGHFDGQPQRDLLFPYDSYQCVEFFFDGRPESAA